VSPSIVTATFAGLLSLLHPTERASPPPEKQTFLRSRLHNLVVGHRSLKAEYEVVVDAL
jgi:hypothetical protein